MMTTTTNLDGLATDASLILEHLRQCPRALRDVTRSLENAGFNPDIIGDVTYAISEPGTRRLMQSAANLAEALESLLEFAIEANNRLPSPETPADFRAGFGCNQFAVDAFKTARAALENAFGA